MLHFITVLQYCKGDGVYDSVADTCTYNITANYTKLGESGLPEWDDSDVNFSCMRCYYLDYESSEDVTLTLDGNSYDNPVMYCPYKNSTAKFEPSSVEIYYSPVFPLCGVLASVQNIRFIPIDHNGTYPAEEDVTVSLNGRRVASPLGYFDNPLRGHTSVLFITHQKARLTIPRLAAENGLIDDIVEDDYRGKSISGLFITDDEPGKHKISVEGFDIPDVYRTNLTKVETISQNRTVSDEILRTLEYNNNATNFADDVLKCALSGSVINVTTIAYALGKKLLTPTATATKLPDEDKCC